MIPSDDRTPVGLVESDHWFWDFVFSVQKFFSNKNPNKKILGVFQMWINWKKGKSQKGKIKIVSNELNEKLIVICFWYGERNIWTILKTRRFEKRIIWRREILENRQYGSDGHSIWDFI